MSLFLYIDDDDFLETSLSTVKQFKAMPFKEMCKVCWSSFKGDLARLVYCIELLFRRFHVYKTIVFFSICLSFLSSPGQFHIGFLCQFSIQK